jgi:hypothetical protein
MTNFWPQTTDMRKLFFLSSLLLVLSCKYRVNVEASKDISVKEYFNYGNDSVQTGGVRLISIATPVGNFNVWTKRFGNNPRIKILLLHGGPAMKDLNFMNTINWVLITPINQQIVACGQQNVLWKKWSRCVRPLVLTGTISMYWAIHGVAFWQWSML